MFMPKEIKYKMGSFDGNTEKLWNIKGQGAWKKLILEIFIVRQDLIKKTFSTKTILRILKINGKFLFFH